MRSSLVMSLVGATSMALALLVGCGDDDQKPATSKAGQSCTKTADCDSGLSCIGNVCYQTPPPASGGSGGGAPVTPPEPPVLGGEGESCSSRLDCEDPLGCFNNRCTASATGEGGAPSSPVPQLGTRGESCRVNGDCTKDLVCVPSVAAGSGVCDLPNFGIVPTGMTCTGECTKAEDCCQLPIAQHTADIKSCQDIADSIATLAADCAAPATGTPAKLCFLQATYCECGDDTWSCDDDSHACVYGGACVVAAGQDVPTGCPSVSRLGNPLPACNADKKTCIGATVAAGCTNDNSCKGKQIFDSTPGDLCTTGECTCYAGNKQCYRKCARDIDCGVGTTPGMPSLVCDTAKTKLCVPDANCVTDDQCAIANHDISFKCNEGTCAKSCEVDRDCSPTGLGYDAFTGMVCGADKFCASVAQDCNEETQCAPMTVGGLKPFCVPASTGTATSIASAITN
ncbi:MAG TPA: hypothetical protein VJV79_23540 [Polyangiaceae bacterium]|nr:hypothetical protein [Polyangiaceae bacterium]